jgi:hypothetical protein
MSVQDHDSLARSIMESGNRSVQIVDESIERRDIENDDNMRCCLAIVNNHNRTCKILRIPKFQATVQNHKIKHESNRDLTQNQH